MGVYGNLSIAAVVFCCKLLTRSSKWKPKLVTASFWAINVGLMLMVMLDLFPAGVLQFEAVVSKGLWFARSAEFIDSNTFQTLTWLRIIGGSIFTLGGVVPLVYIAIVTTKNLRPAVKNVSVELLEEEVIA
jgi:nitric oxide reductase subunit B